MPQIITTVYWVKGMPLAGSTILLALLILAISPSFVHAIPAFPTAEGRGINSLGGRGGAVYKVTNLTDNTSPGSLRHCVNQSGPRTCVFDVAGTITLTSRLDVNNPFLTIAGQTAPGDGILLRNNKLRVQSNDVIARHFRIRLGDENIADPDSGDVLSIYSVAAQNIMIDHMSFSWGIDEIAEIWQGPSNLTIQWSIFSESLNCSLHSEGCHGKGMIFGSSSNPSNFTIHHNLLAHHPDRNPLIGAGAGAAFINNVIYNWGGEIMNIWPRQGEIHVNVIGNYFDQGPSSQNKKPVVRFKTSTDPVAFSPASELYHADNFDTVFGTDVLRDGGSGTGTRIVVIDSPLSHPPVTTTTAATAFIEVLANVGAFPRDATDTRVLGHVQNGNTGAIINSPSQVGGFITYSGTPRGGSYDTDGDGIPNAWETLCSSTLGGLNPSDGTDGDDIISGVGASVDGYSKLEVFINELAGDYELNSCGVGVSIAPYTILKTASGITVDGILTEFADANPIVFSGGNGNETTVKLIWDNTNLYIGAITTDTELNATNATHDASNLYLDDGLEFVIDTENNGGWDVNDYKIHVTALGTTYDRRNLTDLTWEGPYTKGVALVNDLNTGADDTSWSVEIEIPWTSLGMSPVADDVVSINFQVNDLDSTRIPYSWNGSINTIADAVEASLSATEIGADTIAPTGVAITSPTAASTVRGIVQISADAVDETAMSHVVFTRVGAVISIGIDSTGPEPWTISWNTHTIPDGSHDLRVEAFDTSNNSTVSADITVTVDNVTLSNFAAIPTSPSTSAAAAPTFPDVPTTESTSAAAVPTFPGLPTSPSTSASGTPTFPGVPTGAIIP